MRYFRLDVFVVSKFVFKIFCKDEVGNVKLNKVLIYGYLLISLDFEIFIMFRRDFVLNYRFNNEIKLNKKIMS